MRPAWRRADPQSVLCGPSPAAVGWTEEVIEMTLKTELKFLRRLAALIKSRGVGAPAGEARVAHRPHPDADRSPGVYALLVGVPRR
jgi:hypothetical protein